MMTKEQWITAILGAVTGTYAMSREMRILAGITVALTIIFLIIFDRRPGGGWWYRDDVDPSPIDPGPGGIELCDRELANLVNSWSLEAKRENV
jgi:hypothetical protein